MHWRTLMSTENISRTPIVRLKDETIDKLYIKREDLIPYSFGGNKARKAALFFEEIDQGGYDYVVTYGSSHSNHCRVVANMASERNLPCLIIGPKEVSDKTYNSRMMELFGAKIMTVPVEEVSGTIDNELKKLKDEGKKPYFIMGGGHGNIGTQAYVDCYREITEYQKEAGISFDYIFFASGTGTTQAGLVCGKLLNKDDTKIVGISIARKNPRGRDVVLESIRDYLGDSEISEDEIENATEFVDTYTGDSYGEGNSEIDDTIRESLIRFGIPMDSTYTGKAFCGMKKYVKEKGLENKTILFIHTGGTPLFFDDLDKLGR